VRRAAIKGVGLLSPRQAFRDAGGDRFGFQQCQCLREPPRGRCGKRLARRGKFVNRGLCPLPCRLDRSRSGGLQLEIGGIERDTGLSAQERNVGEIQPFLDLVIATARLEPRFTRGL
jgi:hypothetical protein